MIEQHYNVEIATRRHVEKQDIFQHIKNIYVEGAI